MAAISTSNFRRLIGVWKTFGQISSENQVLELAGTDSYELILDGKFILHKADVTIGSEKSEIFEMISLDETTNKVKMQYFNSKGESGIMTGELTNNNFKIEGEGIKFSGMINSENSTIVGKWYLQTNNKSWKEFIDMKLEKQL
ncbi:MAG: hypothetical protein KF746_16295 [Chitinophagaceae bacterium]|nr:hypothetical protein [Chitinophagaceae bacterium]